MDPNETLRLLREWAVSTCADESADEIAVDGAEMFNALDEWLSKGGFLPDGWADWSTSQRGSGVGR